MKNKDDLRGLLSQYGKRHADSVADIIREVRKLRDDGALPERRGPSMPFGGPTMRPPRGTDPRTKKLKSQR